MAKIVRLTENDLIKIVKKVIKENTSNDCDKFVEFMKSVFDKYYFKLNTLPEVGTSSWDDFQYLSRNVDSIVETCKREYSDHITSNDACWGDERLDEIYNMVHGFLDFAENMKKDALETFNNATKLGDIKSTGNRYGGFGDDRFYDELESYHTKKGKDFYDDEFDTEEFSDFESYREKYPRRTSGVRWFNTDPDDTKNKEWFNSYQRNTGGKPFKIKTRKMRD
jgi:hypothetical protein